MIPSAAEAASNPCGSSYFLLGKKAIRLGGSTLGILNDSDSGQFIHFAGPVKTAPDPELRDIVAKACVGGTCVRLVAGIGLS